MASAGRIATALAVAGVVAAATAPGAAAQDPGDLPLDPQWLSNTLQRASTTTSVQNNTIPGAIERRDKAIADWKAAQEAFRAGKGKQPNPLAKPEYVVVWSAKQNAGDVYGKEVGELISNATVNPQGLADFLNPQFLPGLDGWQVIDERKRNVDA